ncbi:MAG: alpha/beta fold hydrolase [Pararobbsia sp.]
MTSIFQSAFHDGFGTWPLAYIPYGGADFGEVESVARRVGDGDDSAFYEAWVESAQRFESDADTALARGKRTSARELYLRASCFYSAAYHPLFGEPVDPRLLDAFRRQIAAFDNAMRLGEPAVEAVRIPFEHASLPAYVIPAEGRAGERRPLLILTNGYDATITDLYFFSAVAASRRGYHVLIFDGPGQGEMLYEHGVRLRPDWETVINAVVNFALTLDQVDPARIALYGCSLGGYLAPRAASGEPRLAACIADPGQWSIATGFRSAAIKLGAKPEDVRDLGKIDDALLDRMWQLIKSDRKLYWTVVQRGFWVNGAANLREYLASVETFTMAGRAELIRCPTLLAGAEDDPLGADIDSFFEALRCPKQIVRFTAAEGAGDHCEMRNRSLLNRRVLDWLGEVWDLR